jgi:hypothetical protein
MARARAAPPAIRASVGRASRGFPPCSALRANARTGTRTASRPNARTDTRIALCPEPRLGGAVDCAHWFKMRPLPSCALGASGNAQASSRSIQAGALLAEPQPGRKRKPHALPQTPSFGCAGSAHAPVSLDVVSPAPVIPKLRGHFSLLAHTSFKCHFRPLGGAKSCLARRRFSPGVTRLPSAESRLDRIKSSPLPGENLQRAALKEDCKTGKIHSLAGAARFPSPARALTAFPARRPARLRFASGNPPPRAGPIWLSLQFLLPPFGNLHATKVVVTAQSPSGKLLFVRLIALLLRFSSVLSRSKSFSILFRLFHLPLRYPASSG